MTVGQACDHLSEDTYSFTFWQPAIPGDVMEKLAAFDVL